jgi:hypothetical protein
VYRLEALRSWRCVVCLALACGKATSAQPTPIGAADVDAEANASADVGAPTTPPAAADPALENALSRRYRVEDPIVAAMRELLRRDCGGGFLRYLPYTEPAMIDNGDPATNDLAVLIAAGEIVPGASARSPFVQRLQQRVRSGEAAGCPTAGEVALLARFVDELDLTASPGCVESPTLRLDDLYGAMARDI